MAVAEIAIALKVLDVVMALVQSGFTFDAAFQRVSGMIRQRQAAGQVEISDADLMAIFNDTDAKIEAARQAFQTTLNDPNTPVKPVSSQPAAMNVPPNMPLALRLSRHAKGQRNPNSAVAEPRAPKPAKKYPAKKATKRAVKKPVKTGRRRS